MMTIFQHEINRLDGSALDLAAYEGQAVLIVNVASKCGLSLQYEGLQKLHERYAEQGFTVVGVPCNQFMGQEPGSPTEIAAFCDSTYGVTFPLTEKVEVNGEGRHPLYAELTLVADAEGRDGDIQWNFEKFLVASDGTVTRFAPGVTPEDESLVAAVEAALPAG